MPEIISVLDVIVAIILGISAFKGWRNGLLKTVFGLVSVFLALSLANTLAGHLGAALRMTPLFGWLQRGIAEALGLGTLIGTGVEGIIAQSDIIAGLPLPGHLLALLHANNNPEVHNLLGITRIEDYIAGFIASMIINVVGAVLVFALVLIVLRVISNALRIFNHIPIIGSINRIAGALGGVAFGALTVWIIFAVMVMVEAGGLEYTAQNTWLARYFYENNPILNFFLNILEP